MKDTTVFSFQSNANRLGLLFGLLAVAVLSGCSASRTSTDELDESRVLARIDGEPVTMADVSERVGDQLAKMELDYRRQHHHVVQNALEAVVRERLLEQAAAEQGVSVAEYVAAEPGLNLEVSDAEVTEWFQRNQSSLGGRSLEELAPRIKEFLETQARQRAFQQIAARLSEGREVVYLLEPIRAVLNNDGAPAQGPKSAPVTLVEFSDFQCPFCARVVPTLDRLKEEYGDKLRIVFRQFPIQEIHPQALKAAEASLCADDQGRFWEMHDLLFEEQDELEVDALKEKADRLGLDRDQFTTCLDSGRHAERVQRDLREGSRLGITGTPAIFVNGVQVPGGAVPYEMIAQVIDDELARIGAR